ncbi:MAG: DMT family transporter [Eggerthellaceae bacterium]
MGAGAFLGLFVAAQFVFNTAGLTDTTAAKSAFLTGTYCAFVPFLAWAISRIRPTIYNIVAMALCVVGVGFVSFADGFESLSLGFGEAITLLSALFVGLHIAFMAKLSVGRDPITLTVVQFIVAGILGSAIAFAIDGSLDTAALGNPELLGSILYLALFASCLSLTLQNIGLAHVPPAPAALLLATESVFGVLFSILFLHEIVTTFMVIGFTLIGAGIVVSEALPLKKRRIPIEEVVEEEMRASQEGCKPLEGADLARGPTSWKGRPRERANLVKGISPERAAVCERLAPRERTRRSAEDAPPKANAPH